MHKAGLSLLAILIKMKIIINLWRLQHERSTFNTNYPEYPALLLWRGVGVGGWRRGRGGKEVQESSGKRDNEGRETQIGENNILVGRFA